MSDFEDELESIEEFVEAEYEDDNSEEETWLESSDDLESDQWSKRFGESYIEDNYDVSELDDDELERMEEDFFDDDDDEISSFGDLDEVED